MRNMLDFTNIKPARSKEIDALAIRASQAMKDREGEDVEEWAMRLAMDVVDAND